MIDLAKISSIAVITAILSGCTYSSDAIFPSLFGSDVNEANQNTKDASEAGIVLGTTNFEPVEISKVNNTGTFVGQKVITFQSELSQLQSSIKDNNSRLQEIRRSIVNNALQYHKTVAAIETKLQVGTTPGNPNMFANLDKAHNNIQVMSSNSSALNQLLARISADTANTDYLVEAIRSAYSISGAVDEDHDHLRTLENQAGQTSILMHSLLREVNADIARQQQYIDTANTNISNLSDAIRVGHYGSGNQFSNPTTAINYNNVSKLSLPSLKTAGAKPLFAVKFNNPDIRYIDGLKQAIGNAVAKKPDVVFNVVAINSLKDNKAQSYASNIFQDIIDLGIGADKVNISSKTDSKVKVPTVMVFVE